jgi:DNA-binding transcriptional LysR family regulator
MPLRSINCAPEGHRAWLILAQSTPFCALGWGGMPVELAPADLSRRTLVKIVAEDVPKGFVVSMRAVYRTDAPPGIAGRWFIDRLRQAPSTSSTRVPG